MQGEFNDLTGRRFSRLTVICRVPSGRRTRWKCLCDCGNETTVLAQNLLNSHVRSCGCFHMERQNERVQELNLSMGREIHGETKTRLYQLWIGIKTRCCDINHHTYPQYGGRGITICEEWKNSFVTFRDWSLDSGYSDKLTIDRINNDGNYEPDNCRWVNHSIQNHNKRGSLPNTSGCIGVSFNKRMKRYVAYINVGNQRHSLGSYATFEDARAARKNAEIELYG